MIAEQIAQTMEQMVAKETPALVCYSLDYILRCSDKNARTGVRSVNYSVIGEVFMELLREQMISETLYMHNSTYFCSCDAADKV